MSARFFVFVLTLNAPSNSNCQNEQQCRQRSECHCKHRNSPSLRSVAAMIRKPQPSRGAFQDKGNGYGYGVGIHPSSMPLRCCSVIVGKALHGSMAQWRRLKTKTAAVTCRNEEVSSFNRSPLIDSR